MTTQDLRQIELLLKEQEIRLEKKFTTKSDLEPFATKNDIKNFVTRDDLKNLKQELLNAIEDSRAQIIASVDEFKADKEEIKILIERVEKIERVVFS